MTCGEQIGLLPTPTAESDRRRPRSLLSDGKNSGMRVLCIDSEAMGLDFVLRCAAAGHEVKWYRYEGPKKIRDGEGMKGFTIVDDWRPHMPWAKDGLIMTTGNWRFIHELDDYRQYHGYKVFGPTVGSSRLEIQRGIGMDLMKSCDIAIPHYEEFSTLEDAEKFARKSDKAYVFKPMGDETDKSLTYVAKDPADLCGWLRRRIARGVPLKGKCMLQEKIDMIAELGVSGWFGPDGFLPGKWQIAIEHKKLMNGECGPATGEQGTICQYVDKDKLARDMLLPLEPALQALGHRGDFAVNCGIGDDGIAYPFEYTARLGWPAFFIQVASHRGDPAQWMRDLLDGKDTLKVRKDVAIGVVLAQPRYPYNSSPAELVEGNPISGVEDAIDDLHLVSVMMGRGCAMEGGKVVERPIYQTSGEYVAVATGLGTTIERARKKVYETVKGVCFPNAMYRTDVGEKVQKALPALHRAGYALEMSA